MLGYKGPHSMAALVFASCAVMTGPVNNFKRGSSRELGPAG